MELIQSIELDRERITKELKELEVLKEVEEMNSPEAPKEVARRPKEFLWLNLVYKNLYFSRRALQNIIELQYSHDIFPSLPDALAALNNCSVESLLERRRHPLPECGQIFPSRWRIIPGISGNTAFPRTAASSSGSPGPRPGISTPFC